ncbi:type II secretion system protein [Akkermansiaceae bacterium]|nr:type II secretion system protein [Akkermansiaceae bacterium]
MKNNRIPPSHGFTLVELLVVIAIVAVLAALSSTAVFRFRKSADKVAVTNNLRQIQAANMGYATEQNGKFVPPSETVEGITYLWFENPDFLSQIKGGSATYAADGSANTSLELSMMDPAVIREKPSGYKTLAASYGYTTPVDASPLRKAQLDDASRTAAFITADAPFAGYGSKANIAYRHGDKAIVVFHDGHAIPLSAQEIAKKSASNVFWGASAL